MYDLAREVPRRLTSEYQNMDPLWSLDGERVVFSRFVDHYRTLHVLDAGSVGQEPTRLLEGSGNQIAGSWSPDGQLLFTVFGKDREDLWRMPSLDHHEAHPVLQGPGRQGFGSIHPREGHLLAYTSDKSGVLEVFVCTYPDLSDEQQVTFGGGSEPLWSWDGTELFVRRGVDYSEFFSVPVRQEDGRIKVGDPTRLFGGAFDRSPSGHQHYDVSRDAKRFALVETLENEARSELRVMLNWTEPRDGDPASSPTRQR